MLNCRVEILDQPFVQDAEVFPNGTYHVETGKTAQITFLLSDGNIDKVVGYGYKPPEEIQTAIDNQEPLILNGCYVDGLTGRDRDLPPIRAIGALFDGNIDFCHTRFTGDVEFWSATFSQNVDFSHAAFNGSADFRCTSFGGKADFKYTEFNGNANFWRATFKSNVNFMKTMFNASAVFWMTDFSGDTDFWRATFKSDIDIKDITVTDTIRFYDVRFLTHLNISFAKCHSLIFSECVFEKTCSVSSASGFESVSIHHCKTAAPFFIPFNDNLKHAILCQRRLDQSADTVAKPRDYTSLAQQFNFLKICYNRNGAYEEEDQAYVEYRRCLRKSKRLSIYRGFDFLVEKISCYCTDPLRVLIVAFIVIFAFAGIFYLPAILHFVPDTVKFGDNYQGSWGCLYHSIITFFTIGYGDSRPLGTFGLILTGLEGFIGVFLMSLFTVSFVRKMLR